MARRSGTGGRSGRRRRPTGNVVARRTRLLHVAPGIGLPLEAATETFGLLAARGAGKSNGGSLRFRVPAVVPAVSPVRGLLRRRCPSAVSGRVRTVVVDPVYGMTRSRSAAHVAEESRKVPSPAHADGDAAPSILGVVGMAGVQTPGLEATPRLVLSGVRHTVRARGRACALSLQAAACQDPLPKVVLPDRCGLAAVAVAPPVSVSRGRRVGFRAHAKSAEAAAREYFASLELPHVGIIAGTLWGQL